MPALFHAYTREEHVGFIENSVKHIKERVRCVCHAAGYKRYTRLMTISFIERVVDMLKKFPSENDISEYLVPSTIVEG